MESAPFEKTPCRVFFLLLPTGKRGCGSSGPPGIRNSREAGAGIWLYRILPCREVLFAGSGLPGRSVSGPLRFRAAQLPPSVLSFYRPGNGYCRIRGGIVELFHTRCGNIPQIFIYIWPEFGRYFAVNKCFNGNIAVLAQGLNPLSMPSTIIRAL